MTKQTLTPRRTIIAGIEFALIILCLLLPNTQSRAQMAPNPAAGGLWSESVAEAVDAGNLPTSIDRGRTLYQVCSECHRPSGAGTSDGTMPQLAGQHSGVLIKQMMDIRSGLRRNPSMYPYVARLKGPQDLADLATYIETLPIPEDNGQGPGLDLERGKQLYDASCLRCHGERGEGSAAGFFPRLAGQHYRYLVRQLIDVAGGRRGNANPEMVQAIADFSARDVANVADYISRIHSPEPVPARAPNEASGRETRR